MSAYTPGEDTVQLLQSPLLLVTVLMNVGVGTGGVMVTVNVFVMLELAGTVTSWEQVVPAVVQPGEVLQFSPLPE